MGLRQEIPEWCESCEFDNGNIKVGKSKTHFKVHNLRYLAKAINNLKSAGEITIRPPIAERVGGEMAIGVHCDDGDLN